MNIIQVNNVTKKYGSGTAVVYALDNVSLEIEKGEFIIITGASGSGKTTLLNIIGGLDNPDHGQVYINDCNITSLSANDLTIFRRRNIGYVFQKLNLLSMLTVYENITLPAIFDHRKVDPQYIMELAELLGVKDKLYESTGLLSGGEQQRVAILRSLLLRPSIILADEPTGNLDTKNRDSVIELFNEINEKYQQTIIMVTHDTQLLKKASRVIRLIDGKII